MRIPLVMRIPLSLAMLAVLLWAPGTAVALTDEQKFQSTVSKSAAFVPDMTPPVVCVCKDPHLVPLNTAGQLRWIKLLYFNNRTVIVVKCHALIFDPTGAFES